MVAIVPGRRRCGPQSGFTLVEVMVAIAIVAIFAALAAPSFAELIARTRTKSVASELHAALSRTRSEALMRNTQITIVAKSGSWQSGWVVSDPSGGGNIDDRGATAGVSVSGPASVSFNASGRLSSSAPPMFVVTSPVSAAATACVSVDLGGRPYIKMAATC